MKHKDAPPEAGHPFLYKECVRFALIELHFNHWQAYSFHFSSKKQLKIWLFDKKGIPLRSLKTTKGA